MVGLTPEGKSVNAGKSTPHRGVKSNTRWPENKPNLTRTESYSYSHEPCKKTNRNRKRTAKALRSGEKRIRRRLGRSTRIFENTQQRWRGDVSIGFLRVA